MQTLHFRFHDLIVLQQAGSHLLSGPCPSRDFKETKLRRRVSSQKEHGLTCTFCILEMALLWGNSRLNIQAKDSQVEGVISLVILTQNLPIQIHAGCQIHIFVTKVANWNKMVLLHSSAILADASQQVPHGSKLPHYWRGIVAVLRRLGNRPFL